jgi:hypothetical protein
MSEAQAAAAGIADDLTVRAAQTTDKVKTSLDAASETAKAKIEQIRSTASSKAAAAPEKTRQMIGENAAVIGGLGVAIGAIIAASLPETRGEAAVLGSASAGVKRAAANAAQSGVEAAKDAVLSAGDAAAKSTAEADLGKAASQMTQDMSERLKEAADDIVSAGFSPSQTKENHHE